MRIAICMMVLATACSGNGLLNAPHDTPPDADCLGATPTSGSATFTFTGEPQMFTPPACTSITLHVCGAAGGPGMWPGSGSGITGEPGLGGCTQATLSIGSPDVIYVYVGGVGGSGSTDPGSAGYNGGARGDAEPGIFGGGGGGASDIRIGGTALKDRVVVGGGGGGGGNGNGPGTNLTCAAGGAGGGLDGGSAMACDVEYGETAATGGSQDAGGTGGAVPGGCTASASAGQDGLGGSAFLGAGGGGGGGGLFGGGGGCGDGGGGGAGYASSAVTEVKMTSGSQAGHGLVTVAWGTD